MSESITRPKCGRTSYHPKDIEEGYCGWCHDWTQVPPDAKLPRNQLGQRLAPGVWVDKEGAVHFSILEILSFFKVKDTAENRDKLTAMIREQLLESDPNMTIVEREKPD